MAQEIKFSGFVKCGHCANVSPMEIVASYSGVQARRHDSTDFEWNEGEVYEILLCPACRIVNIRTYYWHDATMEPDDIEYQYLYPASDRDPDRPASNA